MPLTPNLSLPYPLLTDDNNPPADIQALTAALEKVIPIGKRVTSSTTNASGFVTVTISPALPFTPSGFQVNVTNSQLRGSVDLANSSASSIRIYFRTITATGSPTLNSADPGPFSWLAYP